MANERREEFSRGVLRDFRTLRAAESKSIDLARHTRASVAASQITTGHPAFCDLTLGEVKNCDAVAMFIDLENFTGRTFWEKPEDVVRLAQAVLGQVAAVVTSYGGFVLGLRGDGLFACFGPNGSNPKIDVGLALGAGAFSLDATRNSLNFLLEQDGLQPVQLRVGADYGRLDFVRTGTVEVSEVNVIGFAANFAAKCEKYANSWEFVAGEGLAELVPSISDWFSEHDKSPKIYQRNYERRYYRFHQFSWHSILPYGVEIAEQLAGSPSSSIRTI